MTTTITIECHSCGSRFGGKPEYVGRRLKCPTCSEVFRVQDDAGHEMNLAPTTATAQAQAKTAPGVAQSADDEFDEWNVPDDFEYKIQDLVDDASTKCKFCRTEMKPEQVLCMKCGYHRERDKMLQTKRGAEAVFEDERVQAGPGQISFGTFSLPILPLAIGGGVAALFALVLLLLAPPVFALLCLTGGTVLATVGHFWIIIVAFREGAGQGLMVWFLPVYWWIYVISRWDETWLGFAVWAVGCLLLFFAVGIFMSYAPEEASAAWLTLRHNTQAV